MHAPAPSAFTESFRCTALAVDAERSTAPVPADAATASAAEQVADDALSAAGSEGLGSEAASASRHSAADTDEGAAATKSSGNNTDAAAAVSAASTVSAGTSSAGGMGSSSAFKRRARNPFATMGRISEQAALLEAEGRHEDAAQLYSDMMTLMADSRHRDAGGGESLSEDEEEDEEA